MLCFYCFWLCFVMFDWSPLGFLSLPKIIKSFIHKPWAHICARKCMLHGEFLQLETFIQTGSILSFYWLIEEGYSQSCWSIVYLHWWRAVSCRVSVTRGRIRRRHLKSALLTEAWRGSGGFKCRREAMEKNIDWLQSKLELLTKDHYFLWQAELFTLHSNAKNIILEMTRKMD